MISPKYLRPAKLDQVTTPAIVLPIEKHGEPFIVAGNGENAYACFIGENHRFEAFRQDGAQNWRGLAIENIEIEVDVDSVYSPSRIDAIAGSLVRAHHELQLMVIIRSSGFRDVVPVVIQSGLPAADDGQEVGFTRWRTLIREGDRVIELNTVDATPAAQ